VAVNLDAYEKFIPLSCHSLHLTDKQLKFSTSLLSELQLWRKLTFIWLIFNLLLIKCETYEIRNHKFVALNLKIK